jgi:hypothetical protein
MACIVPENLATNEQHPYHRLLDAAFNINLKFNALSKSKFIFQGDVAYRKILGFPASHCTRIEEKLSASNIQNYCSASFEFLYSLNQYDETHPQWDEAFLNSDQFILYRMLLVKQLSNLFDSNNVLVDPMVKKEIQAFVQQKLKCSSEVALSNILSQSFLMTQPADKDVLLDQLGHAHAVSDLAYIADAIRVDIGYMSTQLTPQDLLGFAVEQYLKADSDQIILGYHHSSKLTAEFSEHFYSDVEGAIIATKAFIDTISNQTLLKQTGTMNTYISVVLSEINQISHQIKILTAEVNLSMTDVLQKLTDFSSLLNKEFPKLTIKAASSELIKKEIASNAKYIAELESYIENEDKNAKKEEKSSMGFFRSEIPRDKIGRNHKHSRKDKIMSALALKNALENLDKGQEINAYDWNNEIFTTSKHLKPLVSHILREHKQESLSALFLAHTISQALVA